MRQIIEENSEDFNQICLDLIKAKDNFDKVEPEMQKLMLMKER